MNPSTPAEPLDQRGLPIGYPYKPDWEVTPRETKAMLMARQQNTPGSEFTLLDCRLPEEFQLARINGSVLIPLQELEKRTDELEGDDGEKDRPIVVLCHHGRRSLRATGALRAMGFTNVRSMAGGIDLWSIDIDRAVQRY